MIVFLGCPNPITVVGDRLDDIVLRDLLVVRIVQQCGVRRSHLVDDLDPSTLLTRKYLDD